MKHHNAYATVMTENKLVTYIRATIQQLPNFAIFSSLVVRP
jgi:hypothetical protein